MKSAMALEMYLGGSKKKIKKGFKRASQLLDEAASQEKGKEEEGKKAEEGEASNSTGERG